jgi:hypothetical protein
MIRERRDQDFSPPREPDFSPDTSEETQELHDEGELFLAAADDAINRALSGNSNEFLAQNRQQGGQ